MALKGSGTVINPYLISTQEDIALIKNNLNAHYKQINDITLPEGDFESTANHTTIGNNLSPFRGTYDGDGYKIIGMKITNRSSTGYQGFFAYIQGKDISNPAIIKNLTFENPRIDSGGYQCGVLAGYISQNTQLQNISINGGYHIGTSSYKGFIAGSIVGSSSSRVKMSNIIASGSIIEGNNYIGGIAGNINYVDLDTVISLPSSITTTASGTSYKGVLSNTITNSIIKNVIVNNITVATSSTINGIITVSNPTAISSFSPYLKLGDKYIFNMIEGSYPYLTFVGFKPDNPIGLSTEEDLELIRGNLSGYFELQNDIPLTQTYKTYVINDTFTGDLNGQGYSFTDIDVFNDVQGGKYAFFYTISGKLHNIGFKYKRAKFHLQIQNSSSSSSIAEMALLTMYLRNGTLSKISVTCETETESTGNYGMIGYIYDNSTLEDTYYEVPSQISGYSTNSYGGRYITLWGQSNSSVKNITVERNVARVNYYDNGKSYYKSTLIGYPNQFDMVISGLTINNNVFYTDSLSNLNIHTGISVTNKLSDFQNPSWASYNNFDKENTWKMESGRNPILKIFNKIVIKIEQRLVETYSKIFKGKTLRYKGRLDSVKSFSKAFTSKSKRYISTKLKTLSYAIKNVSKTYKKSKGNKDVNSYVDTIKTSTIATKLRKTLKNVKSFTKKVIGKTSNQKKVLKQIKGFTKKIGSNIKKYKGVLRTSKSFVKRFFSNSIYSIGKLIKVKSYTNRFEAKIFTSLITKMIIKVKSYSLPIISKLRRFSNIYKFVRKTVKGYANAIVGKGERKGFRKLIVISFTKGINGLSKSFYLVTQIQNVMAIITHKFSKMKIFKRENESTLLTKKHNTKINQKDDGGEG